jgi:hypothetical protein
MLNQLRQVHRAIAEVARRTEEQQLIVAKLVRLRRDASQARTLLATLRATRFEYEHQRDVLVGEITKTELYSRRNLLPKTIDGSE